MAHGARNHPLNWLRCAILEIGDGEVEVSWNKINRELNAVADQLAKDSHSIIGDIVIYHIVPDILVIVLTLDGCGLVNR